MKLYLNTSENNEKIVPFLFKGYNYQDNTDTYSEVVNVKLTKPKVASNRKKRGKKRNNDTKFVKYILLELYPYFLKHKMYVFKLDLWILKPFMGSFGKNPLKFNDNSMGFPDEFSDKLPKVSSMFPHNLLFSKFVNDVRTGAFNCDAIADFWTHVESNLQMGKKISAAYMMSIGCDASAFGGSKSLPKIQLARPVFKAGATSNTTLTVTGGSPPRPSDATTATAGAKMALKMQE